MTLTMEMAMAFVRKEANYVDTDTNGKAKAFDLMAFATAAGMKQQQVKTTFDRIKALRQEANALQDSLLASVEQAAGAKGLLGDDMALSPWFKFGQSQVVRVYGPRHGADKAQAKTTDSIANVAALLASIQPVAPASRLIRRK